MSRTPPADEALVVPVVEELVTVSKRVVEIGRVRVTKRVRTEAVRIDEEVRETRVEIERVPVDRLVAEAPAPYEDGDTLVVPVVEEVLVVEKRLRVREEIRIRRRVATRREAFETDRRKEEVAVERSATPPHTGSSRRRR